MSPPFVPTNYEFKEFVIKTPQEEGFKGGPKNPESRELYIY